MKCIIIYLSGTGNTEKIARSVHQGVNSAAGNCDLVKFKEANQHALIDYDLIGIGCPVWGFTGPPVIKDFIKSMRRVGGKHVFMFSTHGTYGEMFFPAIVPLLKERGMVVIGTYDCYAPCYGSGMPDPYPTAGHPDEIDLREAWDFGVKMVVNSQKIAEGNTLLIPPVPEVEIPDFMSFMKEGAPPVGPPEGAQPQEKPQLILYHADKCNYPKCGLCMDVCPVDGIDLTVKPAVIADPCVGCGEMCAKVCPTGAMEVNPAELDYMAEHARSSLPTLYLPALEKAEAEGNFRRLLPVEEIGTDTPFYKKHNKHPQWIIGKGPV
jgi:ferredoxin/flavodoxin